MISVQVLDTSAGGGADGVPVALERYEADTKAWLHIDGATTDELGLAELERTGQEATYRLTFDTGTFYAANDYNGIFPVVRVVLDARDPAHRLPLILQLSPHGYSVVLGA